eukprot:Gb_11876 [translate_table: standard]
MGILKGNVTANAKPIVIRCLGLGDVIDGHMDIMIFSVGIPPSTSNYSLAPLRRGISLNCREVSPLTLVFLLAGGRSIGSETLGYRIVFLFPRAMGGDPLVTEPSAIRMDDDVKEILEKAGLLEFFRKFIGFNESISRQVAESWDEGKVKVDGLVFMISEDLIAEASDLPLEGEVISVRHRLRVPSCALGQTCHSNYEISDARSWQGEAPLALGITGNLLLGPTAVAPKSSAESSESEEEEESPSEDCGTSVCKKGSSQKRKPPPKMLVASLAKCSRRSTKLKEKSAEKVKILDYISSEEEKTEREDVNPGDQRKKEKVSVPVEDIKDSTKALPENQNVLKELRSHLKILNALGGSLTGTCACINLLSLEIANYLKEVVS